MELASFYTTTSIRRKDRLLEKEAAIKLINDGEYGILSTVSPEGQPYGIPLSYVVHENVLYIHCAPVGEKLDNILCNSKISFTIVGKTEVIPTGFTTKYESVVIFGKAYIIDDQEEKIKALMLLSEKYCLPAMKEAPQYIQKSLHRTAIICIEPEKITGKAKK